MASDEVISEKVVYLNKEGDLVLVVEMPTSAWGREGDILISGYSPQDTADFVRVEAMRPFHLGKVKDRAHLFAYYDNLIDYVDDGIAAGGTDALRNLIVDFGQVAEEALDSQEWHRMTKR